MLSQMFRIYQSPLRFFPAPPVDYCAASLLWCMVRRRAKQPRSSVMKTIIPTSFTEALRAFSTRFTSYPIRGDIVISVKPRLTLRFSLSQVCSFGDTPLLQWLLCILQHFFNFSDIKSECAFRLTGFQPNIQTSTTDKYQGEWSVFDIIK